MGIPQTGRVEVEFQPLVGGDLKALRNAQIVRLHPQEARHQRPVRAVASAGIGKGAVEADVRPRHFRPSRSWAMRPIRTAPAVWELEGPTTTGPEYQRCPA